MSLLRAVPRFLIFLLTLAAVAGAALLAGQWTQTQRDAYQEEGAGSGLVRNVDAAWRNFNPDNLETQILQFYLNLNRDALFTPVDAAALTADQIIPFHIALGETGFDISERLADLGLIRDAGLLRLYMRVTGIDQRLEAGDFQISPAMSAVEILEVLQSARAEDVLVRILEGRRAEEIAILLQENGIVNAAEFLAAVRSGDLALLGLEDYPLLASKPPALSFEGYLFPDTYRFPLNASPTVILRVFFETLELRVTPELRQTIAAGGLTFHQALTLAAIVEREAVLADERPLIASTYRNRLGEACASEVFGYLGADPTAQYAMGYNPDQDTWWPTVATVEEYLAFNSPYNTYLYPGLPPGPIASPGLAAIEAAANPAETQYCYFVASSGGAHVFAVTGAEHQLNVQTYQR